MGKRKGGKGGKRGGGTDQILQVVDAIQIRVLRPVVVRVGEVPRVAGGLVQPGCGPGEVVAVAGAVVPVHHAAVERLQQFFAILKASVGVCAPGGGGE